MSNEKLVVKMLGEFSVWSRGRKIFMGRDSSGRVTQVFQLLMLSEDHRVSKEKLADILYKYEDVENKNNSINTVIYRLRRLLSAEGLPGNDCILVKEGMCAWNHEIPVDVDIHLFARGVEKSRRTEGKEKFRLLNEVWYLYRGDLLSGNAMEDWVIPESMYYKQLFREATEEMAGFLKRKKDIRSLYELYTCAAAVEQEERWRLGRLDALMEMEQYQRAFAVCEGILRSDGEEPHSPEIMERYREIRRHLKGGYDNLSDILMKLSEKPGGKDWEYGDTERLNWGGVFVPLPFFC